MEGEKTKISGNQLHDNHAIWFRRLPIPRTKSGCRWPVIVGDLVWESMCAGLECSATDTGRTVVADKV